MRNVFGSTKVGVGWVMGALSVGLSCSSKVGQDSCAAADCGGKAASNGGTNSSGGRSSGSAGATSVGGSSGSNAGGSAVNAGSAGDPGAAGDAGEGGGETGGAGPGSGGSSAGSGGSSAGSGGSSAGSAGAAGRGGTSGGAGGASPAGGAAGAAGSTSVLAFDVLSAGLLDGNSPDWEQARDVAIDDLGFIYVVGGTSSPDFPVTSGAYDTTYNTGGSELGSRGQTDGFITKLDPSGTIVWSTYLGSPNYDRIYAVEVDAAHNVYVAGRAGRGFPTTMGTIQTAFAGDSNASSSYGYQDGFVAKLSADGTSLVWSTYFGEAGPGFVRDIAIDGMNRVHVAASSVSGSDMSQKVTSGAAQATLRGVNDSFYARLSADGTAVEYGTYLGGNDTGYYSSNPAVRVLADGTAFFLAGEPAAGAPTTAGAYQPASGGGDDFLLARFDPSGTMAFCTYLGGSAAESLDTHSLAIGSDGNPVIAAASVSSDYPVTDASTSQGGRDIVVSVVSADGTSLLHSTLIGGSGPDGGEGVSVDAAGNVYVTGFTNSPNLPVTAGALEASSAGSLEGFLLVLSPDLAVRRYLSYDGITAEYGNRSSAVTPAGRWAVVGAVWQLNPFPATAGNDSTINGTHGAFFQLLEP
jgi:hypothetical protein